MLSPSLFLCALTTPPPSVFLNGRFVHDHEAALSPFDAGLQHAVGLFETLAAVVDAPPGVPPPADESRAIEHVRVIHLREHMQRLADSARELSITPALHVPPLEEIVLRCVARRWQGSPSALRLRVRLTLTPGVLNLLPRAADAGPQQPTILCVAHPAPPYPPDLFARGITAAVASMRPSPYDLHAGHKTLNYWQRLRELRAAASRGADEALVFDASHSLCGGCVSNVFVVKAGIVRTPLARGDNPAPGPDDHALAAATGQPEPSPPEADTARREQPRREAPVLPGITRRWVVDCCEQWGVPIVRENLDVDDCLDADELFLTNSGWGVLPVSRVESKPIARGTPGVLSTRLVEAWRRLLTAQSG